MDYLDSVIALNNGKLSLQDFEKRFTLQQIRESVARINNLNEDTTSKHTDNIVLGNYSDNDAIMQYQRALHGKSGNFINNMLNRFSFGFPLLFKK